MKKVILILIISAIVALLIFLIIKTNFFRDWSTFKFLIEKIIPSDNQAIF